MFTTDPIAIAQAQRLAGAALAQRPSRHPFRALHRRIVAAEVRALTRALARARRAEARARLA
ncbi:hypothetical protein [Demequina rhizosphaerae]|uniref:hypothetical protein n=1 Tax=Demequina rhizosphaerae TaxID=1638985 RepID=UPI00078385A4|nr:hypothetical protein [Demequina rhizosphaerae]